MKLLNDLKSLDWNWGHPIKTSMSKTVFEYILQ